MNQKCKFPFLYKISPNETIEKNVCSLSMPPNHAECDMLARSKNWTERVPKDRDVEALKRMVERVEESVQERVQELNMEARERTRERLRELEGWRALME